MKRFFSGLFFIFHASMMSAQVDSIKTDFSAYIKSTQSLLKKYPESTLIDIYKYFFQSRFGPEHLISDSLIAFKILQDELKSDEIKSYKLKSDSLLVELLQPEKKYVRIDLSLVKDRIIPLNLFFTAFLQSAEKHDTVDLENWKSDWNEIVQSFEEANLKIKNFREDKIKIENALRMNRLVFSHSQDYKKKYNPHYRVIDYKIFEKFLLPYLKQFRIKFKQYE